MLKKYGPTKRDLTQSRGKMCVALQDMVDISSSAITCGMSSLLVRRVAEVLADSKMSWNLRSRTECRATHSRVTVDMLLSLSMYQVLPGCDSPACIACTLRTHSGCRSSFASASHPVIMLHLLHRLFTEGMFQDHLRHVLHRLLICLYHAACIACTLPTYILVRTILPGFLQRCVRTGELHCGNAQLRQM